MSEIPIVRRRTRAGRVAPLALVLLGASVFMAAPADAAQGPVGLGSADSFAVLAGSGITNTGATTISGDVGTFPTPSETGFGSITLNGANHDGDAVTQGAKDDLVAAYNDAFGRTPVNNVAVELGGSTLLAGVYTSPTFGLTGTLTLDAKGDKNAEFIFQAGSTVIAETNSRVLLLNGADPCHVVWQVGSSATFKVGTQFTGDVLALTSITAQTGATFDGRLLARNGAVTLDNNTITNANCATSPGGGGTTTTTTGGTGTAGGTTTTLGPTGTGPGTTTTTASGTSGTTGTTATAGGGTTGTTSLGFTALVARGGSATPIKTSTGTPATPTATQAGTPKRVSPPTSLAFTGVQVVGLLVMGLGLLGAGAIALVAGHRKSSGTR